MNPSKRKVTVLKQISKLIPRNLVPKLASNDADMQKRSVGIYSSFLMSSICVIAGLPRG